MTFSLKALISIGVAAFLVGIVTMLPARVVYHWIQPPGVAVSGIQGTAWNGKIAEMTVNGVYLSKIEWRLQPSSLLVAKLKYELEAEPAGGFFESLLAVGVSGDVELQQMSASLPLASVAGATGIRGLTGLVSLQMETLTIEDGFIGEADGTVRVANVRLPLIGTQNLGGYEAVLTSQDDGLLASVEDTDGIVDIAGALQISPDRSYSFVAAVAAKPDTPDNIAQRLQFLPPATSAGKRELRLEGKL